MSKRIELQERHRVFVLDDPLRRCYNGAFGAHHYEWSAWAQLESNVKPGDEERKLAFWRDLNKIAVDGRGDSARKEFRTVEIEDEPAAA